MTEELIKEAEEAIAGHYNKQQMYSKMGRVVIENDSKISLIQRLTEALKAKERITISDFGEFDRTISLQSKQDVNSILGVIELLKMKACCSQNAKSEQQESLTVTGEQAGELLPCPFCKSTDIDPEGVAQFKKEYRTLANNWENHTPEMLEHKPSCNSCGATTNGNWNTRATPDINLDSEGLVEEVAIALYNKLPWLYEDRVPTTMVSPAYEKVTKAFTWEELNEDDHLREYKKKMLDNAQAAIKVIKEKMSTK